MSDKWEDVEEYYNNDAIPPDNTRNAHPITRLSFSQLTDDALRIFHNEVGAARGSVGLSAGSGDP